MTKLLLAAVNAKYIHSNPAVYSLRAYAGEHKGRVEIAEYTINHRTDDILGDIYKRKPDVICFSCYIWNIGMVCTLAAELSKLMPKIPLWMGGPEVSFESEAFLGKNPMVKGLMLGEGEAAFRELCAYYANEDTNGQDGGFSSGEKECPEKKKEPKDLSEIPGLLYRTDGGALRRTAERKPLPPDELPFCYEELMDFENRIIYYETSRGCPFRCSYCLSSLEKSLRFKSLPLIYRELSFFLEHKVPQVKLVDRTFNCNHEHAMAIWEFIKKHDNGITNFHFEVSADLFTEEELVLLNSMRPGLVQLEIGVQTANERTIKEIHRTMDINRLEYAVKRIQSGRNIHQHLDLIAGLPFEDFKSFQDSFNRIYGLHPEQLQLGFLKVLKGSFLYEHQEEYGILYHDGPPYEVLSSNWLSYGELLRLKLVEELLEVYYNSGQYEMTMQITELSFETPFTFFTELGTWYEKKGLLSMNHSRLARSRILLDFLTKKDTKHLALYEETLTFDLYLRENMKSRPGWAPDLSGFKEQIRAICPKGRAFHAEPFFYDFSNLLNHDLINWPQRRETPQLYLFDYENRNPLTHQAGISIRKERIEFK